MFFSGVFFEKFIIHKIFFRLLPPIGTGLIFFGCQTRTPSS